MAKKTISYEQAGVSIDANDTMVERIGRSVASTHGPRVIGLENGFAGLFRLDSDKKRFKRNYKSPVLVACTDGVGTKVLIAQQMNRYDTIGQDLVAMNVNDMLVQGAEPLFFLDYVGINKLDPAVVADLVESIAKGCRLADCALIGGETAEMPDIYTRKGEYDLAGFAVGVVERNRIITGSAVKKGDIVLGLASSGVHSNGYTLVRHILFKQHKYKPTDRMDELDGQVLGNVLLEPTRIYVRSVVSLLNSYKRKQAVHGMAHITGGGLVGNIPRVLPDNCDAVLKTKSWPVPAIFPLLQRLGPVDNNEMYRVFNMGIGFVLIVAPESAGAVRAKLEKTGETVYEMGHIAAGSKKVVLK
jgi:phosphoribosylformylglycinamidine cyclo-ligase